MTLKRMRIREVISFLNVDLEGAETPHDDVVVIFLIVATYDVITILVNNGSSNRYNAFQRMNLSLNLLRRIDSHLINFSRELILIEGVVTLLVIIGQKSCRVTIMLDFLIMKVPSTYHAILN